MLSLEGKRNFAELTLRCDYGLDFNSWVTDLLECNTIRFISREIDEDVWRETKNWIEDKMSGVINNII
jgi:hypothetical protein